MVRTAIALLGLAVILAYLGLRQWEIRAGAADEPARLSLREVLARGPGDNAHVTLTGFDFCDRFAYAEKRLGSGWSAVFFPIVPAGERAATGLQQETARVDMKNAEDVKREGVGLSNGVGRLHGGSPLPATITAIVVSKHLHSDSDVAGFSGQRSVQGLVVKSAESLNRYEQNELQGRFPSLDISKCLLIEEGRAPPGRWLVMLLFGSSGALVVFAGGSCAAAYCRRPRSGTAPTSAGGGPAQVDRWVKAQGKRQPD